MNTAILTAVIVAIISFICQKTISNLLYGLIILITRPFKKGDKITITHYSREIASGRVIGIGPLHIRIKRYDRDVISVPNSLLETSVIENSDYKARINYTAVIKISQNSNYKKAKEIIKSILLSSKDTYNTEDNTHLVTRMGDKCIEITYNVRSEDIDTSFQVASEILETILDKFQGQDDIELA